MEATRSGVTGGSLLVAKDAEEELRIEFGLVPIPRLQTEDEIAASWELINKHGDATHIPARVNLPD